MTIEELKLLNESEDKIEFKEAKHNYPFSGGKHTEQSERRKCFLGYIVALANEKGGMLVLGMSDKAPHQVVGSDFRLGKIGALEDETFIRLGIRVHIEELFENGLRVVVVKVPSRPLGRMMKFEAVPLMRTGDALRNMTDEEIFSILSEQEPDFSAKICPGLTLQDLDENAIELMKDAYSKKQKNPSFKSLSTSQVLTDLKLLENGNLNYAALILIGQKGKLEKLLPQAKITWEFRYTEAQIHYDFRETIQAPLFEVIDNAWALINDKNAKQPVASDAYIFPVDAFNEAVIREALLNAVTHRDYTITSEVVIKQYPQKIVILNPGGFPKGVNIENLIQVSSTPRSRLLAEILEKTGLVERSGQGVDKIYSLTLQEGKREPNYKESNEFQVSLQLEGNITDAAFYIFMLEAQERRGSNNILSVDEIISLYKIKQGVYKGLNEDVLYKLESEGLIVGAGHSTRFTLADKYYHLSAKEKKIGNRYIVPEVENLVRALRHYNLKIGQLEEQLTSTQNRNQIKYLLTKLIEDKVLRTEGSGRGTTYKLDQSFEKLSGKQLEHAVIGYLRERYPEN